MARPLTALTAQSHSLRGPGPGPGLHGPPVSGPWATEHHADLQSQRWPGEGAAQCLQLACTKCVMPDPAPLEGKSRLQCGEPRPGHCLTRMEAKEHNVCPSPGSPCVGQSGQCMGDKCGLSGHLLTNTINCLARSWPPSSEPSKLPFPAPRDTFQQTPPPSVPVPWTST